jgi:hypothetical protein
MAAGYGSYFLPPGPDAYCDFSDYNTNPLNLQAGLLYSACYFTITHRLSTADISLHSEIIAVYFETRAKYTNTDR